MSDLIDARNAVAHLIADGSPWNGRTVAVKTSLLPIEERPEMGNAQEFCNVFVGGQQRDIRRVQWYRTFETNVALWQPISDGNNLGPIETSLGVAEAIEDAVENFSANCLRVQQIDRLNPFDPEYFDQMRLYAAFFTITFTRF